MSVRTRENRRKRKKIRVNLFRAVLTLLVAVLLITSVVQIRTVVRLKQEQKQLKKQNVALRKQKAELENEFRNVNNKNYIEEQARMQLNMIKPGEVLYILEDGTKISGKASK